MSTIINNKTGRFLFWRKSVYIFLLLTLCSISNPAFSHFENLLARIVHIAEEDKGVRVYSRLPLALVLLPESWKGADAGQSFEYVLTEQVNGEWRYYVDEAKIESDKAALAEKIISSYVLQQGENSVKNITFDNLKVYDHDYRPSFNSIEKAKATFEEAASLKVEAKKIFGGPSQPDLPELDGPLEVFDAIVDISFFLPDTSLESSLIIKSNLGDHLSIIDRIVNVVVSYSADEKETQVTNGVLDTVVQGKSISFKPFLNQVESGVVHILIGVDHILFIVLLVLAASYWFDAVKKATVFTVGHSLTLAIGAFGYAPEVSWFIPVVEIFIALSIVYAGILLIANRSDDLKTYKVFIIGLIHGFGFASVLNEILAESDTLSVVNFLGFNLGIELGQLFIVLIAGLFIYLSNKYFLKNILLIKRSIILPCILIATYWVFQRSLT